LVTGVEQYQNIPVNGLEEHEQLSKLRPGEAIHVERGHHEVAPWLAEEPGAKSREGAKRCGVVRRVQTRRGTEGGWGGAVQ